MRVIWTLVGALGLGLTIAGILSWRWATAEASAQNVAAAGLFLAVGGLFATLVGFILAIEQIRKGTSASEAAETAIDDIRNKLTSLSASGEIERARFALEESERAIHAGRVKEVKFSLSPARQCLLRIRELDLDIFGDLHVQTEAAIEEMGTILDRVDDGDKDYLRSLTGFVRSYTDLISRMQVRMARG